jgi:diguanylate cyclase (GGDEF)-like protein/PAS domain S-box-containing protein
MLDIVHTQRVLAALLESSEDASFGVSMEGRILNWSPGAARLYGYPEDEVLGQSMAMLLPIYELPSLNTLLKDARRGSMAASESAERVRKDGKRVSVWVRHSAIRDEKGDVILVIENGREALSYRPCALLDPQLRMLVEQIPLLIWTTDNRLRITSNWGSAPAFSRVQPGELVGRTVHDLFFCSGPAATPIIHHGNALRGEASRFEYGRGDKVLDIQLGPLRSPDDLIVGCVGIGLDITERKKTEEDVRFQATHDHLTGLANYRVFMETLDQEIRRTDRSHRSFALLLLDLDDLKAVNDHLGHLAGNRALNRLASVMKEHCRSTDLAARYGGDEFGLILIEADAGMAEHMAARIESCLGTDPEVPSISASIGMAMFPSDARSAQELLEVADRRLYKQKRRRTVRGARA